MEIENMFSLAKKNYYNPAPTQLLPHLAFLDKHTLSKRVTVRAEGFFNFFK